MAAGVCQLASFTVTMICKRSIGEVIVGLGYMLY